MDNNWNNIWEKAFEEAKIEPSEKVWENIDNQLNTLPNSNMPETHAGWTSSSIGMVVGGITTLAVVAWYFLASSQKNQEKIIINNEPQKVIVRNIDIKKKKIIIEQKKPTKITLPNVIIEDKKTTDDADSVQFTETKIEPIILAEPKVLYKNDFKVLHEPKADEPILLPEKIKITKDSIINPQLLEPYFEPSQQLLSPKRKGLGKGSLKVNGGFFKTKIK